MSIKVKFIIVATISLVVTITAGLFLLQNNSTLEKGLEKEKITDIIQNDAFESNILRDDYLLHHNERPLIQLRAVSKDFGQILGQASEVFISADERGSIGLVIDNKKFIDQALSQIIAKPSPELEQQLIDQILIKSQDNITAASQLSDASRNSVTDSQQRTIYFVLILIIGISLIIIVALYFIWRSIGRPLLALKETVVRIAALDFTTTTTTTTTFPNDEMGQLARAFNNMINKLKESYTSLKNANIAIQNILDDLSIEKLKIEKEKAKSEAILESIGEGIIAINSDRRIIIMNKVAEKLLGWKIDETLGKFYNDVVSLEDEKGTFVAFENRPLTKALTQSAVTVNTVFYIFNKNKIKFPVAITVSPIILDGKTIGVVEVFRDITHEQEIDKAKSEFVSLASHQLRTPLTAISWYTEMVLGGKVGVISSKQKKYLQEIYHSNKRMITLVNTLLNVSRIETGTLTIELKPTNIIDLAQSVLDEQKHKIKEKRIKIIRKLDKTIPIFSADSNLLRMVFQNLLSNAVKYTGEGGTIMIEIALSNVKNILIKISDTGYGIPYDQQGKIFTKFFRADNVREKDTDGTGLGLYIVKSIIEKYGGKIWFESPSINHDIKDDSKNSGTTFYVEFPMDGMTKLKL